MMEKTLKSLHDVAQYLKISEKTVYKLVSEGEIPGSRVGGQYRFSTDDLDKFLKENAIKPKETVKK